MMRRMPKAFDPDFASALEAADAIRTGQVSSLELTEHTLRRIDQFQPRLNAFVYQLREEALEAAKKSDEAIARGTASGRFHGVPISVKESFGVQGRPCTWGIPPLAHARATRTSTAVQRLMDNGAILLGGTNVPLRLMDAQTFNSIYGRTNNPWDLERTPGGSSGGSAACVAAGLGFFSLGSDIGGSIRSPASFCGVYGHKPTLDVVPLTGHSPGGEIRSPGFSTLLAVAGPMARSAEDLQAALEILAGPEDPDAKAIRLIFPPPRHTSLRDFRVGFVLEDPEVPVCPETRAVLEQAVRQVERAGATVKEGWPEGFKFRELMECYYFHLGAFSFSMTPPPVREAARRDLDAMPEVFRRGALSSFADWQWQNFQRLAYRAAWERYFQDVDVFLSPTTFTAAIRHDLGSAMDRAVEFADGSKHNYWHIVTYICPATLTGCPATTAPVGLTKSGLPVGIQIMGPYAEDSTTIQFAAFLAGEVGGFRPPGYRKAASV
jgi:amidase